MSKCLIAEYDTSAAAKLALEVLEKCGFTLNQVSVVANADDPAAAYLKDLPRKDPHEQSEQHSASAPEGRSTSLGMLIGGTVAAPIAAGTLVGPFIIAGPLLGMAIGAAVGGLFDMESWGVEQDTTADYQQRVKSGSVLVIVHDVDQRRLSEARTTLNATDPKSLSAYVRDGRVGEST
ncbi:hypothetical protein K227x_54750 [Rubripirellula lacrimiformis]|uniref:DUF1269 domain-containing protein n=1 Tax=Rubripirellula lacrimiformis TaxID=1930273 RepID=A0A517NIT5_9BACT|nr:DUF1269 domain-containing protein [Rubripirellula lacrimiformis]QDT07050.1 hypothetical protein K227x_54750 [Rubripirellula lacrimiformis]